MTARIAGFITREQAGLRKPRSRSTRITPSRGGVAIHWGGGGKAPSTLAGALAMFRGWQDYHMDTHGWVDLAYSLGVTQTGHVVAGRGAGVRTAANGTNAGNQDYYAVVWIGGADGEPPTREALDAIEWAVLYLRTKGGAGTRVRPHEDFTGSSCPGRDCKGHARRLDRQPITEGPARPAQLGDRTLYLDDDAQLYGEDVGEAAVLLGLLDEPGPAYFGPRMEAAVLAFQRANGLDDDGRLGPRTLEALRRGKVEAAPAPAPAPTKPPAPKPDPGLVTDPAAVLRRTDPTMHGEPVRAWQGDLWARGAIGVGPHDGRYGPDTEAGTRRLEAYAGRPVDGVVDAGDRAALARVPRYPKWTGNTPHAMKRGERSDAVRALQQRLRDRGWLNSKGQPLAVDGSYGPETERVVDRFASDRGLPTGFAGAEVWVAAHAQDVR